MSISFVTAGASSKTEAGSEVDDYKSVAERRLNEVCRQREPNNFRSGEL
jgi:hypothetical protein